MTESKDPGIVLPLEKELLNENIGRVKGNKSVYYQWGMMENFLKANSTNGPQNLTA